MNKTSFEENTSVKRAEAIASLESSFYTLSNRVIVPLCFICSVTIPVLLWKGFATLVVVIIFEVVVRYVFKTTASDGARAIWNKIFGSPKKPVRN